MWQDKYVQWIAVTVSFVFPTLLGYLWNGGAGALGAFLIGGMARVVAVQHSTFFINSACHYIGSRPYSVKCSARDSWFMALFTFGEGYHNYHHEFQYDYRNGVKPWQWDPTKWAIWLLSKLGLVNNLRRVPNEKILLFPTRRDPASAGGAPPGRRRLLVRLRSRDGAISPRVSGRPERPLGQPPQGLREAHRPDAGKLPRGPGRAPRRVADRPGTPAAGQGRHGALRRWRRLFQVGRAIPSPPWERVGSTPVPPFRTHKGGGLGITRPTLAADARGPRRHRPP